MSQKVASMNSKWFLIDLVCYRTWHKVDAHYYLYKFWRVSNCQRYVKMDWGIVIWLSALIVRCADRHDHAHNCIIRHKVQWMEWEKHFWPQKSTWCELLESIQRSDRYNWEDIARIRYRWQNLSHVDFTHLLLQMKMTAYLVTVLGIHWRRIIQYFHLHLIPDCRSSRSSHGLSSTFSILSDSQSVKDTVN